MKQKKYTKKEIEIIEKKKIKYKDGEMFLHCNNCLKKKPSCIAPCDWARATVAAVTFKYPDGVNARIIAIFCERCKKRIWDTRHLKNMY